MRREEAASYAQHTISLLQAVIRNASESVSLKENALMALSAVMEGIKEPAGEAARSSKDDMTEEDVVKAADNATHGTVSNGADRGGEGEARRRAR